jgi:predicted dehydrogenase
MANVRVGLIGCGFVAELHMYAYKRVYGIDVEVAAVAARGDHVIAFAKKHRIPTIIAISAPYWPTRALTSWTSARPPPCTR